MCITCGCGDAASHAEGAHDHAHDGSSAGWHTHADGTRHRHGLAHAVASGHDHQGDR